MTSYRQTAYNDFETPSGAVGEAPDGPGAFAHVMDQVDARLSFGGAEYCANAAAVAAIPTSRAFKGKLVYRADNDCVYRYVGAGNTALGANDGTHWWQSWSKPATVFTPTWTNLTMNGAVALYGISEGLLWYDLSGTVTTLSTSLDVILGSLPFPIIGAFGSGSGQYQKGASTVNNNQIELAVFGIGVPGQSSTQIRVRARYAPAADAPVTANVLGSTFTQTSSDTLSLHYSGPSAGVL